MITEHSITLQWQLNCVDEPIVAKYNITYCPVDEPSVKCDEPSVNCLEPMLWNEATGNDLRQFEIVNLKSYKYYRISIALLSNSRHGVFKAPLCIRTLESGKCVRGTCSTCRGGGFDRQVETLTY